MQEMDSQNSKFLFWWGGGGGGYGERLFGQVTASESLPALLPPALPRPNILNLAPLPHYSKPSYAYVLKIEQFRFSTKEAVIKIDGITNSVDLMIWVFTVSNHKLCRSDQTALIWAFTVSADPAVQIIELNGVQYFKHYPKYCIKEIF